MAHPNLWGVKNAISFVFQKYVEVPSFVVNEVQLEERAHSQTTRGSAAAPSTKKVYMHQKLAPIFWMAPFTQPQLTGLRVAEAFETPIRDNGMASQNTDDGLHRVRRRN